jgi:hypothetical protein
MKWTPEERLNFIWALAAKSVNGHQAPNRDLMIRIMFLCESSEEFLELNKANYQDAIDNAGKEEMVVL